MRWSVRRRNRLLATLLLLLAAQPAPAFASSDREVHFESAGRRLVGTLVLPDGSPSAPAVLIIVGSGPVDRDGRSPAQPAMPPIYRMWAERLARSGIASLRYDKRFLTHPDVDVPSFDQEDQIDDAVAAFQLLASTPGVDRSRLFVLGHSEGGTLAPLVAERSGKAAGVIVVNSVVFPVDELLVAQLEANPAVAPAAVAEVKSLLAQIEDGSFPPGGVLLGAGAGYWRQWIDYSGSAVSRLSRLPLPILLIQCERDETLPGQSLTRNLEALRTIAKRNPQAQLRELEGLSHLGIAEGRDEPAESLLSALTGWIQGVASPTRP